MMLVGTSLGKCLKSIAIGEVDISDVLVIIARTDCKTFEDLMQCVEIYHKDGNKHSKVSDLYDMSSIDVETLKTIASDLWHHGKIHQPRIFNGFGGFVHIEMSRGETWIPLAPSPKTDDDRIVEAYERYLVLKNLIE